MTARRAARAQSEGEWIDTGGTRVPVPPDLLEPDAAIWRQRGCLCPADRLGATTHPANRRQSAAEAWALDNRFALFDEYRVDLNTLRNLGLIADHTKGMSA